MKNKKPPISRENSLVLINESDVEAKIAVIRGNPVIADADVAELYDVETRRINEAVKNNPNKFPTDYMFELTKSELRLLRSKISTTNVSSKSRSATKVFTEKGLYMLATVLKSDRATDVTFAIIETFAKVRAIKRELVELHKEVDKQKQASKMKHFGEVLSDIVMPELNTAETESTLELNFVIGKIKHTVKRVKREN
ncbi:MAG: ORF6N domain-containing protein [Bacteroidales bacterium]|nr:ORF6N domain-containing protein [Bacteroidales bacterium]